MDSFKIISHWSRYDTARCVAAPQCNAMHMGNSSTKTVTVAPYHAVRRRSLACRDGSGVKEPLASTVKLLKLTQQNHQFNKFTRDERARLKTGIEQHTTEGSANYFLFSLASLI